MDKKKNKNLLRNFATQRTSDLINLSLTKRIIIASFLSLTLCSLSILLRWLGKLYGPLSWLLVFIAILIIPFLCSEWGGITIGVLAGITIIIKMFVFQQDVFLYLSKPETLNFWIYILTMLLVLLITSLIGFFLGKVRFTVMKEIRNREIVARIAEEKFSSLSDQPTFGIMSIHEGEVIDVNLGFSAILDYNNEDLMIWNVNKLAEVIHEEERQVFLELVEKEYQDILDAPENQLFRVLTKTGDMKWIDFSFRRLLVDNRQVLILTISDITDIKKAHDQTKYIIDQLHYLIDRIRNPLAVILSIVELREKIVAEKVLEQINKIVDSVEHIEADLLITLKLKEQLDKYFDS